MYKRFISEVHPPVPVVLIYASESGSQGFGVPVMTGTRVRNWARLAKPLRGSNEGGLHFQFA